MPGRATYFLSDLHLGANYFPSPIEAERRIVRFLHSIKDDAAHIYLVGDILDYWFEYKYTVPRGYTRFLGTLALLSDSGIKITWLTGNHDIWIFDYLPSELGIEVCRDSVVREIGGSHFFISHGDGVGSIPLSFRILRGLFHNRFCQRLYAAIHPRWTIPLAHGWSSSNRGHHPVPTEYSGVANEPLMIFAKNYLLKHPEINYFIFGHRHVLVNQQLTSGCRAIILGNWIDLCSYARFTPEEGVSINMFKES